MSGTSARRVARQATRIFTAGVLLAAGAAGRARAQAVQQQPLPSLSSPKAPTPAPVPAAPEAWLKRSTANLQILNKVDATETNLSIPVGKTAKFSTLTITVEACLVRPPDQPRDAAAYLEIKDKHPALANFRGWLLAAEPSVSVFEHPIYDVRLVTCGGAGVASGQH